jgi:excisionase family DNA binding protein
MEPLLISIEDAARLVGIGRDAAYAKVEAGEWPSEKVNKRQRKVSRAFLLEKYGKTPEAAHA